MTEQNRRDLRERCIQLAVATPYISSDRVLAQAQTYFDFITGSHDGAILAAAKELAKVVKDD